MGKVFGSSCLIAGTAIGAGILALPMVLIQLSLWQSIALMGCVWGLAYYSALLGSELVLRAQSPLSLGALSLKFSGQFAQFLGQFCFLALCYALLSAYLDGTSSLIFTIIPKFEWMATWTLASLQGWTAFGYFLVLILSLTAIDHLNRILFIVMILILGVFSGYLGGSINYSVEISPILTPGSWSNILASIPVVFTSFGFQIIFHTIGQYLGMCPDKIKKSFYWGSLIPAIIYILWTCVSLLAIATNDPKMIPALQSASVDVGGFMMILGSITQSAVFSNLSWILSILAIVTSAIGVGLGLVHTLEIMVKNRILASALTIVPAYIVVSFIPGAFIHALGFAGMILVVIALLLPLYLLYRSDDQITHYTILSNKGIRGLVIVLSCGIMVIEICHLLNWL